MTSRSLLLKTKVSRSTLKGWNHATLKTRFAHVYGDKLYTVATVLDPRNKGKLFSPQQLDAATAWLLEEIRRCPTASASADDDDHESAAPPAKRLRQSTGGGLRGLLDEVLAATSTAENGTAADVSTAIDDQVKLYLAQPNAPQSTPPLV